MNHFLKHILLLCLFSSNAVSAELPVQGEPLKKIYRDTYLEGMYVELYQTGKSTDSFSFICNMGQALPDTKKEGWYENKTIPGLSLELRARLVKESSDNIYSTSGFVVVTKNREILKTFKPLGEYINGEWDGDFFNSWSRNGTKIEAFDGISGKDGYVSFDLLEGMGFYYKSRYDKPRFFLSNCRRIKKKGLPIYKFRFTDK